MIDLSSSYNVFLWAVLNGVVSTIVMMFVYWIAKVIFMGGVDS